ncbi:MAG: L-lactate permease, partial [Syntrophobacterales bacterium]
TMDIVNFILSWIPLLVIMVLAVGLKRQALELAFWGTLCIVGLVFFWFKTSPSVVFLAAVDGVLTNMPLLLVIYFGMLLSGLLLDTGSLTRVVDWFSGLTKDHWHRTVLITVGTGNFMEGAGIVAEPIVAPMLRAAGLPATGSAALSIAGYSGLMILELGGAILTVLALVTGLNMQQLGREVAYLSIPATVLMVLSIPWLLGQAQELKNRFLLFLTASLLASGGALFAVFYLGLTISGLFGGLLVIIGLSLVGNRHLSLNKDLFKDMAPFVFLVVSLFTVNLVPPLKRFTVEAWPAAVSVVPGHVIHFRPLHSAYTYIFLSYILALLLERDKDSTIASFLATNRRAWKPVLAMALFGAAGQIIAYSGFEPGFQRMNPTHNIALTLANGMVVISGQLYPVFAPLIGWVGTFLTGYGTASIVLFGKLQVTTANLLQVSPSLLASGMAVGSAVGSISSPLKIALAASMCGAEGREGWILARTIPLGIGAALVLGLVLLLML